MLDRSGSMADGRLHAAKPALESLVDRLDPSDNFGLVTFDDDRSRWRWRPDRCATRTPFGE